MTDVISGAIDLTFADFSVAIPQMNGGSRNDGSQRSRNMINCAIAGLGRRGRSLVNAASGLDRLKISRAVETDLDRARPFCTEHGIRSEERRVGKECA